MEETTKINHLRTDAPAIAHALIGRTTTTTILPWRALEWTSEQLDIVRKVIAPPTATPAEVDFFIAWCRRTGLDPFTKQAYLIERYDSVTNTKKHEPMAAEQGMAALADSMPDFRGMKSGVVYAGDEFLVDELNEDAPVVHRWSIESRAKAGNRIIGAWAHGKRDGRVVEVTYLTLESRKPVYKSGGTSPFWVRDAAGQMRKCARADQYRRLYQNLFAGAYIEGELLDSREVEVNEAPASTPAEKTSRTEALKRRLGVGTVTLDTQPEPKGAAPSAAAPPIDCVRFGPRKGQPIADTSTEELKAALKVAQEQLAKATGKEGWHASVQEGVGAIETELMDRDLAAAQRQPGEDG